MTSETPPSPDVGRVLERLRQAEGYFNRQANGRDFKDGQPWRAFADDMGQAGDYLAALQARETELTNRVAELERRARLSVGTLPCSGCGGPHPFDTSVPSVLWNAVIRSGGEETPEYLCTTCIVRAFAKASVTFTATLWGDDFGGLPIEVIINGTEGQAAHRLEEQYIDQKLRAEQAEADAASLRQELARCYQDIEATEVREGTLRQERDALQVRLDGWDYTDAPKLRREVETLRQALREADAVIRYDLRHLCEGECDHCQRTTRCMEANEALLASVDPPSVPTETK